MKKCLSILVLAFATFGVNHAQEYEVEAVQQTGDIDNRINLVFLAEGYLEEDLNKFITDVQLVTLELFVTVPFKEYKDYFNVFAIKVPSNERGASRDPNNLIDNAFGSTYFFGGIERLLVPTKNDEVANVLADNFPEYDQAFVLVNDDKYGGSGGWLATSSTNQQAGQIAIHEIGHSMANLADEYWAGPQFARETANMTQVTNPQTVKWKSWINHNGVGIFPYEGNANWQRPHQNCKMEILGPPFCAVCREQFIATFYSLTNAIDFYSPDEASNTNERNVFVSNTKTPNPNSLRSYWMLDGDTVAKNQNAYTLEASSLSDGAHELTFNSVDFTELSRKDELPIDVVTWSLTASNGTATYNSSLGRITVNRSIFLGENVTGVDDEFIKEIGLKTAPNPVTDRLTISFYNPAPAPFSLQLIDLNGKAFQTEERELLSQGDQEFVIDTSGLEQGIFLVQMVIGNKLVVKKILK